MLLYLIQIHSWVNHPESVFFQLKNKIIFQTAINLLDSIHKPFTHINNLPWLASVYLLYLGVEKNTPTVH